MLFFCIITLFTIYIVLRDEKGKAQNRFISNYYLSRIIKIFSCLIFLIAYMLLNKPDALRFAIAFLVVYFMYSIFEVVVLKKEMSDMGKPAIEESDQKTE